MPSRSTTDVQGCSYREGLNGNAANVNTLAYVGTLDRGRDSNSWYTPQSYIEKARRAMGSIDLDPFSSADANLTVGATRYFDIDNSALTQEWSTLGRINVFINPPFGISTLRAAVNKFLYCLGNGQISQAIVLLNNNTETASSQALMQKSSAICLVAGRIAFHNVDGKNVSNNTRGQVFYYFGNSVGKFTTEFSDIGTIYRTIQ